MCGIVGYIGNKQAPANLNWGLKRQKYRGYDSSGIVTINNSGKRHPAARQRQGGGAFETRVNAIRNCGWCGYRPHTRWATHGEPNKRNAHPHRVGDIYLVHNGIIENYQDPKAELQKDDYDFKSDTDSEVLAALIDKIYQSGESLDSVRGAPKLVGTYGIAVMSVKNPGESGGWLGSPLIIGVGDGEQYIRQ